MLSRYSAPPCINSMYVHFARRCYEEHYSEYRQLIREGSIGLAENAFAFYQNKYTAEKKMPHILNANQAAIRSAIASLLGVN